MVPLTELYHLADEQSYNLYWIRSSDERICSMSVTDGIHCAIMLDPSRLLCEAQQRQMLAMNLATVAPALFIIAMRNEICGKSMKTAQISGQSKN